MENQEDLEMSMQERDFIAKKLKDSGKDSPHISEGESKQIWGARDDKEEKKGAESGLIAYKFLGRKEFAVPSDSKDVKNS